MKAALNSLTNPISGPLTNPIFGPLTTLTPPSSYSPNNNDIVSPPRHLLPRLCARSAATTPLPPPLPTADGSHPPCVLPTTRPHANPSTTSDLFFPDTSLPCRPRRPLGVWPYPTGGTPVSPRPPPPTKLLPPSGLPRSS
jgi:hypothetical protein